jgi:tetratricopeptide (TPR) repeat protein
MPEIDAYSITRYARFWISKKQNEAGALDALEKSLKMALESGDEMSGYAIQNAATIFTQAGKPERVLEFYGPAFAKANWDDPDVLSGYARFWAGRKTNLESALAASERAVTLKEPYPGTKAYYLSSLGAVYQALGRLEEAKKAMEKALEASAGVNSEFYESQLKKIQEEIDKKKK